MIINAVTPMINTANPAAKLFGFFSIDVKLYQNNRLKFH